MFKHVLVPMDGSDHARAALDLAVELADEHDAEVTVLGALDAEALMQAPFNAAITDASLAAYQRYVDAQLLHVPEARRGKAVARYGEPATLISAYAKEQGADVIVMSTHGLGAKGGYALGSVALKVLQHAPCPVLLKRID
ncbi:MAG: universal stress protein [Chloroflexi bacterium]|nr:universal stress protein [Chloroflexota bacterium]MDA1145241.1 universal stress protein [Chloroflexota bacterium]